MSAWKFSSYRLRKNGKFLAIVLGAVAVLCILGGVIAAYVWSNTSTDNQISGHRYYFTLDVLGDTNEDSQLSRTFELYGGNAKNFTFTVQNFFDSERISEAAAHYKIGVRTTAVAGVNSTYTDGVTLTCGGEAVNAETVYSLGTTNKSYRTYNLSIPEGYEDGDLVIVDVASTKPYLKTMTLVFELHTTDATVGFYVEDSVGSPYAKLYVMSSVDIPAGDLVVDWSGHSSSISSLQLDLTNSYFIDQTTYLHVSTNDPGTTGSYLTSAKTTQPIKAGGSIAVMFFKGDPNRDYSLGSEYDVISATEENGTYTVNMAKVN